MKNHTVSIFILLLIVGCSSVKRTIKTGFSLEDIQSIMNADSSIPMRIYKITNKNDSLLLRTESQYIKPDPNNKVLKIFVKKLYATVRDSLSMGIGIAAPQVGVLKNIIWIQRFDKENFPFEVYLNPKIIQYSDEKQTVKEGCLSIPNRSETLNSRAKTISIEYDTMDAEHKTEIIEGFTSVIFQHEIDHLNGILYLDHLVKDVRSAEKQKTK